MTQPFWLDHVLAKSAEKGSQGQPETLSQHTWSVLERFSDMVRLRPNLPVQIAEPRLWHRLFWSIMLHDLGKAATGFQDMLRRGSGSWSQRHEVLSLAFVDWLFPSNEDEDRVWVVAAIVSHHKEPDDIAATYSSDLQEEDDSIPALLSEIPDTSVLGIWRWLDECPRSWTDALGLQLVGIEYPILPPQSQALQQFRKGGARKVHQALDEYLEWVQNQANTSAQHLRTAAIALRGHVINADHSASAHVGALPRPDFDAKQIMASRKLTLKRLRKHQKDAWRTEGSALLTAPTGTGKTEAALLWAAHQAEVTGSLPRLFYTLPYQASMNAMKLRLDETFGKENVGLQHGRGLLALYRLLLEKEEYAGQDASQAAKWALNLARLNYPPVRVFSPYQMLKGMYRLKGYEALLTDYHGAAFIFDEIHAYEVKRLALILKTIEYLRRNYNARFLVMSATFPSLVKGWLREILVDPTEIGASRQLFKRFQRHRLHLVDGELLEDRNLERIAAEARAGRTVLVVANIVARAQEAYRQLEERLRGSSIKVLLLHGRFNMRDRSDKEKAVRQAVSADSERHTPIVLVATQTVEVSLDIDLDTIYTEPAPMEALVQRFGRINRRNKSKRLAPVHVFRQPDDGQVIYDTLLVQRTLSMLERQEGRPVDESAIGDWLDEIYKGELAQKWQAEYTQAAAEFDASCIRPLRPFASDDDHENDFYKMFDSIEVLPESLCQEYIRQQKENPILAEELVVSISWRSYCGLKNKGLILPAEREGPRKLRLPPITRGEYTEQLGLTNERAAPSDWD